MIDSGAPTRTRTADLLITNQLLYQLSYRYLTLYIRYLNQFLRVDSHGTRCLSTHDLCAMCAIYGQMCTKCVHTSWRPNHALNEANPCMGHGGVWGIYSQPVPEMG